MMNYLKIEFRLNKYEEYLADILSASLADMGFESFVSIDEGLEAYIQKDKFYEDDLQEMLDEFPFNVTISYKLDEIETVNWNEEWEKNFFEPIVIGEECVIHSTFHKEFPRLKYDIVIDPKMAFGTGHHETTSLVISEILKMDLIDKNVLDMGCGTAVLAILASMRGAEELTAIDIDDWCVENSLENLEKNGIFNVKVELGGAELLEGRRFDVVIANINRNILLQDMNLYVDCLPKEGKLFMSGFYTEDIPVLMEKANSLGMKLISQNSKNNWAVIQLVRI